jgi:peptide/nickel transport system permease protein
MSVRPAPGPSPVASAPITWRLPRIRLEGLPLTPIAILLGLGLLAIFADFVAPHNPEIGSLSQRFKPPAWVAGGSAQHLLGTDHIGRDVLSRLIFGARV